MNELDAFLHGLSHWAAPVRERPFPARSVRGIVWAIGAELRVLRFCAPGGIVDLNDLQATSAENIQELWRCLPVVNRDNLMAQRNAVRLSSFELAEWIVFMDILNGGRA